MKVTREEIIEVFEIWNNQILNKEVEVDDNPYNGDKEYSELQADHFIELLQKLKHK